jgi:nickel-dependent lactate racemase
MIVARALAGDDDLLSGDEIRQALAAGLSGEYSGQKVLVLIPDHTRTLPLPLLFRMLVELLHDAKKLDFMVALGTHPALSEEQLRRLVGISAEERTALFKHVSLLNHAWDEAHALSEIGILPQSRIQEIAGERWHPTLGGDVSVLINRRILEYDHVLILGPTFPHEVVGFSGGAKYLFPGISGADMINVTHWLGALAGVRGTIGIKNTPVRAMIHAAAEFVPTPVTLISLVVVGKGLTAYHLGR